MGHVLIYGGSGATGAAAARLLVAAGYAVHLAGRNESRLAAIAAELGAGYSVADAMDETSFARVSAEVDRPLSGLVYAVGSITLRPLSRLPAPAM